MVNLTLRKWNTVCIPARPYGVNRSAHVAEALANFCQRLIILLC